MFLHVGIVADSFADCNKSDAVGHLQHFSIRAVLPSLPAWESVNPGDIFRVFEKGGRNIINLHKTRLNDPFTWFLGTNDQPGDYRSSGCASCHVVYANDRNPRHSGPYAAYGHSGESISEDPTIPEGSSGHPLEHKFTQAIPTSQCMVCHMHQPNMFVNSFLGYTMWDYESDGPFMWPEQQQELSIEEQRRVLDRNPEGAVVRGKWADVGFLKKVADLNPQLNDTHVCRLSRPWLELPCSAEARPAGQPA